MSLIPTVYDYTDAGAPALTGQAGSLNALLRACLVTGYGSGSSAKPPAGWTEPFPSSGNVAVFRNSAVEGSGSYLRVDDSGAGAAGARAGLVKTYKSMSDLATGLDVAPNPAVFTGDLQWIKSGTLDGVSRPWWAIANSRALYLFTAESLGVGIEKPYIMADLLSHKPGDQFHNLLAAPNGYNSGNYNGEAVGVLSRNNLVTLTGSITSSMYTYWLTRSASAVAGAVRGQILQEQVPGASITAFGSSSNSLAYPDPVSGGLLTARLRISEGGGIIRGALPGIRIPLHSNPFADRTLVDGVVGFPTMAVKAYTVNNTSVGRLGQVLFDVGVPWE